MPGPDACSAGVRPKTTPVISATTTVNTSAAASMRTSRSSGMLTASSWVSRRVPATREREAEDGAAR